MIECIAHVLPLSCTAHAYKTCKGGRIVGGKREVSNRGMVELSVKKIFGLESRFQYLNQTADWGSEVFRFCYIWVCVSKAR